MAENKKIKRLSKTTIRRYNIDQLVNHLDICLSKMDNPPYRVDSAYEQILELSDDGTSYLFRCDYQEKNRRLIIEMIRSVYRKVGV
tara:strand:+ start:2603 stop:2860 length:258 start_codon:yes stop_codon:yes gene_type:complete